MNFVRLILYILILGVVLIGVQWGRIYLLTKKVNYNLHPFEHINPNANFKVLFAGDSTAVGAGLDNNEYSTSGLFSRDFPQAEVINYSHNGLRLKGLEHILNAIPHQRFDLAVLQIGANDILNFTPLDQIRKDQKDVLNLTKQMAKRIIILHSGDIGEAPLLIWPFNWIYTSRSLKVRDIYLANQDDRASYIDIYTLNKSSDLNGIYAKDGLHLNEKGYALWYSYIKNQLQKLHWLPIIPS